MTDFDGTISNRSIVYFQLGQSSQGQQQIVVQYSDRYLWNSSAGKTLPCQLNLFRFRGTHPPTHRFLCHRLLETLAAPGFTFQVTVTEAGTIVYSYRHIPFLPSTRFSPSFGRNYPLVIGVEETVLVEEGGFCERTPFFLFVSVLPTLFFSWLLDTFAPFLGNAVNPSFITDGTTMTLKARPCKLPTLGFLQGTHSHIFFFDF